MDWLVGCWLMFSTLSKRIVRIPVCLDELSMVGRQASKHHGTLEDITGSHTASTVMLYASYGDTDRMGRID